MRTFQTTDIHLSAALKLHGFKLLSIDKNPRTHRGSFVFEDRINRPKLVQAFFDGSLQGSLKQYVSIWGDLKGLVSQVGPESDLIDDDRDSPDSREGKERG